MIEVNPEALEIADALDAERKSKGPRGPLHGIPVLIKDNIDTADRMMTTAGSLALGGIDRRHATRSSSTRLRAAGAVILGKTNLSEWANFRSTPIDERLERARRPGEAIRTCWIATRAGRAPARARRSPRTWRPWASAARPTGRSSVRRGANGLVGIKPTVGLVSRTGIIPISHTQDTAGRWRARWPTRPRCSTA